MNGPPLNNMKELRLDLKMTQAAFAESLGISKTTYNNYETGAREPGHKFIVDVALKYNVTTDYLLGLTNNPISASFESSHESLSLQEIKIVLAYRNAPKEIQEIVDKALYRYMEDLEQEKTVSAG